MNVVRFGKEVGWQPMFASFRSARFVRVGLFTRVIILSERITVCVRSVVGNGAHGELITVAARSVSYHEECAKVG